MYEKSSEGAPYNDGTSSVADRADDFVSPGKVVNLTWTVPVSAGPGPQDPSTIGWMYHSHSNEIEDPVAGLVGLIIIGNQGSMRQNISSNSTLGDAMDVDREVVFLFSVMNERSSFLWQENVNAVEARDAAVKEMWLNPLNTSNLLLSQNNLSLHGSGIVNGSEGAESKEDEGDGEDAEEDLMHSINGKAFRAITLTCVVFLF